MSPGHRCHGWPSMSAVRRAPHHRVDRPDHRRGQSSRVPRPQSRLNFLDGEVHRLVVQRGMRPVSRSTRGCRAVLPRSGRRHPPLPRRRPHAPPAGPRSRPLASRHRQPHAIATFTWRMRSFSSATRIRSNSSRAARATCPAGRPRVGDRVSAGCRLPFPLPLLGSRVAQHRLSVGRAFLKLQGVTGSLGVEGADVGVSVGGGWHNLDVNSVNPVSNAMVAGHPKLQAALKQ